MSVIARMVRKDLLRKLRSPMGVAIMLAFPITFAGLISLSFGEGSIPRAHILVENRDDGMLGNLLISALTDDQVGQYFEIEVVDREGEARIGKGDGSALLRIPEGFTLALIEGEPTTIELIRNPAQGIMPEVAEQIAGVLVEGLDAASRVLRGPLDTIAPFLTSDTLTITNETVAAVSVAIKGTAEGAFEMLDPPVITFETVDLGAAETDAAEEEEEDTGGGSNYFSVFLFVFPGVSVWSLFVMGDIGMRDLVTEAEAGTLRRQLQGPVGAGTVIAAKILFTATLCAISLALLTLIGWIAIEQPVDPLGYAALSLALVLAVTGAGALIYGASGSQQRGSVVASVVYLTLAFAGGSFFQVEAMPAAMRAVAPVSPFYWGTQGYRTLLQQGGLADVLMPIGILAALGILLAAAGASLMSRKLARGALA